MRDETFVEAGDEEVAEEDAEDEFASYFSNSASPNVILTTYRKHSGEMFKLHENLFTVIPNAYYYARRAYHIQEIVKHATARGFTDLLVFNENKKFSHGARVNGLLHVHLPEGPTCLYRLSSLVLTKKIRNHGRATGHYPELILNNFSTRLGHRVGRMFASVFPQKPDSRATASSPSTTSATSSSSVIIDTSSRCVRGADCRTPGISPRRRCPPSRR